MIDQDGLTLIAPIRAGEKEALESLLIDIGSNPDKNEILPFGILGDVHFARIFIIEGDQLNGIGLAPNLCLISVFDGPLSAHINQLVNVLGSGLEQVFRHCEGYPDSSERIQQRLLDFINAHQHHNNAFYVNTVWRTVKQIESEKVLREAIEAFLDRPENKNRWKNLDAIQVREEIRKFVGKQTDLKWALQRSFKECVEDLLWKLKQCLVLLIVLGTLLVLSPILVPVGLIGLLSIRYLEKTDVSNLSRSDAARVKSLREDEDQNVTNQFSAAGFIKPGIIRFITVNIVLIAINFAARYVLNRGNLAGVTTIHFARWVIFDGGKRLIFASNYDGSLESYMGDFIDKVAWGLNAAFSNGVDYPKTDWLIFNGAKHEQNFKYYIRTRQLKTHVWYSRYNGLTAVNIENNSEIRNGLVGTLSLEHCRAWLRRL